MKLNKQNIEQRIANLLEGFLVQGQPIKEHATCQKIAKNAAHGIVERADEGHTLEELHVNLTRVEFEQNLNNAKTYANN